MVIAMFLAHLVGDFVLQWDALAEWKSRDIRGVIVHGLILFVVTALFALPFDPTWWSGILLIGISHFAIDALWFYATPPVSPLLRFIIDQVLHFLFIILALILGGFLEWGDIWGGLIASAQATPVLTGLLGYAFLTMPAWVLLKFVVYGMVNGQPPDFPAGPNKFVGIGERLVVTTLVLSGQALLIPLVALPRLILDWPRVANGGGDRIYLTELISSVALAAGVGWIISALVL